MALMLNIVLASTTASGKNQHGQPVRTVIETGDLDTSALRLPLSACGRRHPTDGRSKILPYLDIPLQHASPRILKLMKRPVL